MCAAEIHLAVGRMRESGAAAWNFSGARPTHKRNGLCRGEYIYDLAMFSPHCDSASLLLAAQQYLYQLRAPLSVSAYSARTRDLQRTTR